MNIPYFIFYYYATVFLLAKKGTLALYDINNAIEHGIKTNKEACTLKSLHAKYEIATPR